MSVYEFARPRRAVLPSPLFLAFVAVAAVGGVLAWTNETGSRTGRFGVFLLVLAGWIVSVCIHEFMHAFLAYRAGDRSVEARGYLTLNPFKYAHPVLSILLPLVFIISGGIGLPGGAVYLHRHAFRSRAMQSAVAAAGPLANVAMAAVLLWVSNAHLPSGNSVTRDQLESGHLQFWSGLAFLGFLQCTAAVLNLLPVPGLDGWAIIEPYLSPDYQSFGDKAKPWGFLVVLVLLTVNSVNVRFFELVDHVYSASGAGEVGLVFGRTLFKFWQHYAFGIAG